MPARRPEEDRTFANQQGLPCVCRDGRYPAVGSPARRRSRKALPSEAEFARSTTAAPALRGASSSKSKPHAPELRVKQGWDHINPFNNLKHNVCSTTRTMISSSQSFAAIVTFSLSPVGMICPHKYS